MLTIYSGYHLANKKENITLDIRELQPQQKIIEIVTDFVTTSEALEDDLLDVGINTTNPLVIATIEAIAMEMDKIQNLKYVYITEDGEEHLSHYIDDRCEGYYYPNSEYMELKTRYYHAFYKRLRKE
jgi:hypothetical protein|nr:MAG TPA: hypothetical protein [Caudoviricetes sp.]